MINDYMKTVRYNYEEVFGEVLDDDRLNELDALMHDLEDLNGLDDLADDEDATISYGEREAMMEVATNVFNLNY